jgi:hypothetical protein
MNLDRIRSKGLPEDWMEMIDQLDTNDEKIINQTTDRLFLRYHYVSPWEGNPYYVGGIAHLTLKPYQEFYLEWYRYYINWKMEDLRRSLPLNFKSAEGLERMSRIEPNKEHIDRSQWEVNHE